MTVENVVTYGAEVQKTTEHAKQRLKAVETGFWRPVVDLHYVTAYDMRQLQKTWAQVYHQLIQQKQKVLGIKKDDKND